MEILNQNQRTSAIWRLVLIGLLVLAIVTVIVVRTHAAYASQGQGALMECQEELRKKMGENQHLANRINELNKEIESMKGRKEDPNQAMQLMQLRLDGKDDRIKELESDLKRCESNLQAAQRSNQ